MQGTVLVKFFCKTYTVNRYRRCLTRFAKAFVLMVYKQNFLLTLRFCKRHRRNRWCGPCRAEPEASYWRRESQVSEWRGFHEYSKALRSSLNLSCASLQISEFKFRMKCLRWKSVTEYSYLLQNKLSWYLAQITDFPRLSLATRFSAREVYLVISCVCYRSSFSRGFICDHFWLRDGVIS